MQAYISESLNGLDFKSKYGLSDYSDPLSPLVIFGMYREEDLKEFLSHIGPLTLVWQGMDAKELQWGDQIKGKECQHYAISSWIQKSLNDYGIVSTYAPISATQGKANNIPRGNSIYFYTSRLSKESAEYYGEPLADEVQRRTGLNLIKATYDLYTKNQLRSIYQECFINLRLTSYDGCPNGNLEMGLLGRKSVFNGDIPGSIRWRNIDEICNAVKEEYYRRGEDNQHIADLTDIYINSTNNIFKNENHEPQRGTSYESSAASQPNRM